MNRRVGEFLRSLLPEWSSRSEPSITSARPNRFRRSAALAVLLGGLFVGILLLSGHFLGVSAGRPLADVLFDRLYWPTVLAQTLLSIVVLGRTADVLNDSRMRHQWDLLRSSAGGVSALMVGAWRRALQTTGIFVFGLVIAPRLVLTAVLLIHQMAFRGEALSLLGALSQPAVLFPWDIILLAASVTAAFILPLQSLALEAAIGLVLASVLRGRTSIGLARLLWSGMRVLWGIGMVTVQLLLLTDMAWRDVIESLGAWLILVGGGALGDWGLYGLYVTGLEQAWRTIPWAALMGVVLLLIAIVQAILTPVLLKAAVWLAQKRE